MTTTPAYLAVGRICRPHGIHGEVQVDVLTDFPEARFVPGALLYVGAEDDTHPRPVTLATVRTHRARMLLRFEPWRTRTDAEALTGQFVLVPAGEAHALPEGAFFMHQILGMAVWTTEGAPLGRVVEILETGANDVLRVADDAREVLVPFIDDVIEAVDPGAGRLTVRPVPGLLDAD